MVKHSVMNALKDNGWFVLGSGVYAIFDGQFGSTGKGLMAGLMAELAGARIQTVTTNQGPNSGHTAYYKGEKIVTHQLPIASVVLKKMGCGNVVTYLNAGAVIDFGQMNRESEKFGIIPRVHPHAAVIYPWHRRKNESVASLGLGVGPAMEDKLQRREEGQVVKHRRMFPGDRHVIAQLNWLELGCTLMEIPQGWALGINSGIYPYVTSRECSPSQGLSDFCAPPTALCKSIACLRYHPIRTGNLGDNSSGPGWPGQNELQWGDLGLEPEISTTAGRRRRIFEWSWLMYRDMLKATAPDALFLNFCNYVKSDSELRNHVARMQDEYCSCMNKHPDFILLGFGEEAEDVEVWQG